MLPSPAHMATSGSDDHMSADAAFEDLARELYWAQETAARARMGTPEIRDRLHDFSVQMRADEKLLIPLGEGNLASPSRWRRRIKYRLWRVMRPATWRYDRLLADHAELTTGLAEHLMALEAQVERLRAEVEGGAPLDHGATSSAASSRPSSVLPAVPSTPVPSTPVAPGTPHGLDDSVAPEELRP